MSVISVVECEGSEVEITDCQHQQTNYCPGQEDAVVLCQGKQCVALCSSLHHWI